MKKGDMVEARVTRLDFPNRGTAETDDGERIRVSGVLPDQRVLCRIKRNSPGRRVGSLVEVIKKSPLETEEPCPHFARCGGCSYQTLSARNELELKESQVRSLLEPVLEKQDGYIWEESLDSPVRFGYRNKMEFTWGDSDKGGPLSLGLHRRGSMYDIETVDSCNIVDEDYRRILRAALDFFAPMYDAGEVTFYRRMSGEGYLRHLLVRKAAKTGESLVCLVTTSQESHDLAGFVSAINGVGLDGRIAGILHTINDSRADAVLNEGTETLFGTDSFSEELLGLKFRITPFSFFQTNTWSAELIYSKIREYLGEISVEGRRPVVYDLYCGTGTIAQIAADMAESVTGIEIVPEAAEAARENAARNGIKNCRFFAGDVLKLIDDEDFLRDAGRPDIMILDPPRDGIHPKALPKLLDFGASNIIYVSCKPTSLARDLEVITEAGYRVKRICVVNQFPMAGHVEVVCLLGNGSKHR